LYNKDRKIIEEEFDKTEEDIVFEFVVNPFIIKTSVKPNELGGGH